MWVEKKQKGKKNKRIKENKDREEKSGYMCGGEKPRGKKGKKKKKRFRVGLIKFIPKRKNFDKFQD